ncbi:hypothetical protein PsYK624_149250 [Phanerochaete sordida]|uniref:EF-hand domain-containing protein n=1 Tax=Phanerochaete sordida TaxID=48140 RepID=A0A9P3GNF7_9APHY|nr:hypothetical protein PsYK624_149250 [Phanerochaete sordida]
MACEVASSSGNCSSGAEETSPIPTCGSPHGILSMPTPVPYRRYKDSVSDADLGPLAAQLDRGPAFSRVERNLDDSGDRLDLASPDSDLAADTSAAVQMLKTGITTFMDDYHWFMKALDDVAKIHPFVAVPILAFKAVYSMERTRQENDKRIIALYVAMKDMIRVLVQLRNVRDPHHVGPDGLTIEGRLQSLMKQVAEDIKDCANACDTYSKKRLLVKVLKGPIWEARLAEHVVRFHQRRKELKFALSLHTATVTDDVKHTLDTHSESLVALVSLLQRALHELKPPEEALMEAKVVERGGSRFVERSDSALRELLEFDYSLESSRIKGIFHSPSSSNLQLDTDTKLRPDISERTMLNSTTILNDVKDGLQEELDTALQNNMVIFQRKFALQRSRLQEDLSAVIHEGSDRVIQELRAGPHEAIHDEEVRELWREMGWRTNVPSNRFAMTLRDHLHAGSGRRTLSMETLDFPGDDWAIDFFDLPHVQRIKEAFDEDSSGYVTIAEVNRFSDLQPRALGWTLRHWLAYWTIGWQISATWYRDQIRLTFARMFAARYRVLPQNRPLIDSYLHQVWTDGVKIVESLQPAIPVVRHFEHKFLAYFSLEERRIRENLEGIDYNLDAVETITTVVGPGRIETYIFPLLYLLLQSHWHLFKIAEQQAVCEAKVGVAVAGLLHVYQAFARRFEQISALGLHRAHDTPQNVKRFACEVFEYFHDASPMWKALRTQIDVDDETVDAQDLSSAVRPPRDLPSCHCVRQPPISLPPAVRNPAIFSQKPQLDHPTQVQGILGAWNGFVYSPDEYPIFLMTSFHAQPSRSAEYDFEDEGTHFGSSYRLVGICSQTAGGPLLVQFSIHYSHEFRAKYFSGYLKDEHTIVGTDGWTEDQRSHQYRFILKKVPADVMRCRPPPSEFRRGRIAALWKFARTAILLGIRRASWSKAFFAERREARSTLIEFDIRNYTSYGRPLDHRERLLWTEKRGAITAEDAAYYRAMRDARLALIPKHLGVECAGCTYQIRGARIICLDCLPPDGNYLTAISFCDDMRCRSSHVKHHAAGAKPHHISHDSVKVRTVQHLRDMYALEEVARAALASAKHTLKHSFAPDALADEDDLATHFFNDSVVDEYTQVKSKSQAPSISPVRKTLSGKGKRPVTPKRRQSYSTIACGVCASSLDLSRSSWFCVNCFDEDCRFFICNECEASTLLPCVACSKPYKQLSWYHGSRPDDSFMCAACMTRRESPFVAPRIQHSYTHALVQCKPLALESRTSSATEVTISSPETAAVSELRQHVQRLDHRIEAIEQGQARLESMLGQVLTRLADAPPPFPRV